MYFRITKNNHINLKKTKEKKGKNKVPVLTENHAELYFSETDLISKDTARTESH